MDGMSYRSQTLSRTGEVVASSDSWYYVSKPFVHWPYGVYDKQVYLNQNTTSGVKSETFTPVTYNPINGLPVTGNEKNSDGRKRLTKTSYAFENPRYSASMGLNGAYMLTQPCQTIVYEKAADDNSTNILPENVRFAQATTYSNSLGVNAWMPNKSYTWNANIQTDGTPDKTFADYNHATGASNENWRFTGSTEKYDASGVPVETRHTAGISSTTVYRNDFHLPIGSISNANFKECGVFTCDYNLSAQNPGYFDYNNGWEIGAGCDQNNPLPLPSVTISPVGHYGDSSVHVHNAYGPGRNFQLTQGRDYVMSAWVKVDNGTAWMHGDLRSIDKNLDNTWPVNAGSLILENGISFSPAQSGPTNGKWKLLRMKIPASSLLAIKNWSTKNWYARVFVGAVTGGDVYIDDIRFQPTKSNFTTTYYDSKWLQPVLTVGANGNPGKKVEYDGFGRPVKWYKIDKTNPANSQLMQKKVYRLVSESYNPDPGKWYRIVPEADNNFCIDITGPVWANGTPIHLWHIDAASDMSQQWKFVPTGDGYYNIISRGGQTYGIDDPFGNVTDGTRLQIYTFADDNQKWKLTDAGDAYCLISAKANDAAFMDLKDGTAEDDAIIQIWNNGVNARWKLVEVNE